LDQATVILVTLVAYKLLLIGIGLLARGRNQDAEDFFLGGRKLGPVVAAISASASSSSAWTLLGASGFAWASGLSALWLFPACVGGFLINWLLIAPRLRQHPDAARAVTVTDFLLAPYGESRARALRALASLIVVATFVVYVAAQMKAAGGAFERVLDYDFATSIGIGAAVILVYTLLGGFWAVSLTDTVQGMMMAFTAIVLPLVVLGEVGLADFLDGLGQSQVPGWSSLTGSAEGPAAFGFAMGLLGIGLGYPGQPHVVNRFLALDEGEAALRRARLVAIAWAVVVYVGMIVLGLAGRMLFETLPGGDKENLLFYAAETQLPPILAGIMIAAVLSAVMSTADSQLLVAASSLSHDLGWGQGSPRRSLFISRLAIVGVLAMATALALVKDEAIFKRVIFAWSAVGASFGPLLVARLWRRDPGPQRAFWAMLLPFAWVMGHEWTFAATGFDAAAIGVFKNLLPYVLGLAIVFIPGGARSR
jgi:sodium/proline symporter